MPAHGEHVLLARQSSEVAVQDEQEDATTVIGRAPRSAVVIDEGDVGDRVAEPDGGRRRHRREARSVSGPGRPVPGSTDGNPLVVTRLPPTDETNGPTT
jgi:hypothetical protein